MACTRATATKFLRNVPKTWRAPRDGGLADGLSIRRFSTSSLAQGLCVELEHTSCWWTALRIAMDHLVEHPGYYTALEAMETKLTKSEKRERQMASLLASDAFVEAAEDIALLAANPTVVSSSAMAKPKKKSRSKSHKDVKFFVEPLDGRHSVGVWKSENRKYDAGKYFEYNTAEEASVMALSLSMSYGEPYVIDVVVSSRAGAKWYGGDHGVEVYDEDPEASVHERIIIRAESLGRIA